MRAFCASRKAKFREKGAKSVGALDGRAGRMTFEILGFLIFKEWEVKHGSMKILFAQQSAVRSASIRLNDA